MFSKVFCWSLKNITGFACNTLYPMPHSLLRALWKVLHSLLPTSQSLPTPPTSPSTALLSPGRKLVSLLSPQLLTCHHIPINTPWLSQQALEGNFPPAAWPLRPSQANLNSSFSRPPAAPGAFPDGRRYGSCRRKSYATQRRVVRCEGFHSHFPDKKRKSTPECVQITRNGLEFKPRRARHPGSCCNDCVWCLLPHLSLPETL